MTATYALHHINDASELGFDADDYSIFKFGDDLVAKDFGTALANGFIRDRLSLIPEIGQMVVIPSPYSFIPTATFAMRNWFTWRINRWLAGKGLPVIQETKVHRTITYKEDYGELDAAQRLSLIGNDSFHIDKEFIAGKTLVFLDDIKITGSHERMILKMIKEYGLTNDVHMLYFAELVNKDIHPNIENYLNYHKVSCVYDLQPIIDSGHFAVNTRVIKYILNTDAENFRIFIGRQTGHFSHLLYDMAIGNGYHTIDVYASNLNFIAENLLKNDHKSIKYVN